MYKSLKILISETTKNYPKLFFLLVVALFFESVIVISSVITVIPLADYILDPKLTDPSRITNYVITFLDHLKIEKSYFAFAFLFVFTNLFRSLAGILIIYIILKIKFGIIKIIRISMFDEIFSAKWNFFNDLGFGKLMNTLNHELNKVSDITKHLAQTIPLIVQLIVLLIIPFLINFQLTFYTICITAMLVLPFGFLNKITHNLGKLEIAKSNKIIGTINETLQVAKLILSFGNKDKMLDKNRKATDEHIKVTIKTSIMTELSNYLFKPLAILGVIVSVGISINSETNFSELAGIFWSLYSIMPIISNLIKIRLAVNNFLPSYDQLIALREKAKINKEKVGKKIINSIEKNILLDNVNFNYEKRNETIKNISVNIKTKSITAIVGKSGSGKSTLIDLVLGLNAPESGKIFIDNQNINEINLVSYRKKIGFVPQDPILFYDTIKNNLLWANDKATDEEIEDCLKQANAYEFVMKLPNKLNTIVGERGAELSGGERQRVALARAIIRKPKILILDEATSSLDKQSEIIIKNSLKKISQNISILIVAHKSSLLNICDYVYVLKNKKIVEHGNYQKLINEEKSELKSLMV